MTTTMTLAEYEAWLTKWTEYCNGVALSEATRFNDVGAAMCMYAQCASGEIMSAVYIWSPVEARGLQAVGILGDIMWEQRASYMRVMLNNAEQRQDKIIALTYGMYSVLDLPHTGG